MAISLGIYPIVRQTHIQISSRGFYDQNMIRTTAISQLPEEISDHQSLLLVAMAQRRDVNGATVTVFSR